MNQMWVKAAGSGVVVYLLASTMLCLAFRFFLPEIVDTPSVSRTLYTIGICSASIGLGVLQTLLYRRKKQ